MASRVRRKAEARRNRDRPGDLFTPSFVQHQPRELIEVPPMPADRAFIQPGVNSYLRRYQLAELSVIVTREYDRWHLSIAHPRRYPHWDEIAEARYRLIPKAAFMAMLLPKMEEYVNIHQYCMHLYQIKDPEFEALPR